MKILIRYTDFNIRNYALIFNLFVVHQDFFELSRFWAELYTQV